MEFHQTMVVGAGSGQGDVADDGWSTSIPQVSQPPSIHSQLENTPDQPVFNGYYSLDRIICSTNLVKRVTDKNTEIHPFQKYDNKFCELFSMLNT